jgi:hypothetical protein
MLNKILIVIFALMLICLGSQYGLNYWVGYQEQSYLPLALGFFLEVLGCILFASLLLSSTLCLFQAPRRAFSAIIATGLLVVLAFNIWILPAPTWFIVYGLRDRILHDYSFDELRQFAKDVHSMDVANNNWDNDVIVRKMQDELELGKRYPFLARKRDHKAYGPSFYNEVDGVVNVRWGGAIIGHWGLSVAVDGESADLPIGSGIKALRLTRDIFVMFQPF